MNLSNSKLFRISGGAMLAMLVAQYILGMYTNLFVSFPEGILGGKAWEFAWSQGVLASHIILGVLLLIGAAVYLTLAIKRDKSKAAAVWGIIGIFLSGASGALFIHYHVDIFSYLMSLFFLVALFAYGYGYVAGLKDRT